MYADVLVLCFLVIEAGFANLVCPDSPVLSLLIMIAAIITRTLPLQKLVHLSVRS